VRQLNVGTIPVLSNAPLFSAQQKGYFALESIAIELVPFASGAEAVAPLGTGQIDTANAIAPSAGLLNAISQGVSVRAVAGNVVIKPGRENANIVLRKDLATGAGDVDLSELPRPIQVGAAAPGDPLRPAPYDAHFVAEGEQLKVAGGAAMASEQHQIQVRADDSIQGRWQHRRPQRIDSMLIGRATSSRRSRCSPHPAVRTAVSGEISSAMMTAGIAPSQAPMYGRIPVAAVHSPSRNAYGTPSNGVKSSASTPGMASKTSRPPR
jgi:hypothetical protein